MIRKMPMVSICYESEYHGIMSGAEQVPKLSSMQLDYVGFVIAHTDTDIIRESTFRDYRERFGTYQPAKDAADLIVHQVVFEAEYHSLEPAEEPHGLSIHYTNRYSDSILTIAFDPQSYLESWADDEAEKENPFMVYIGDSEPYYDNDIGIGPYLNSLKVREAQGLLERVDTDPMSRVVKSMVD